MRGRGQIEAAKLAPDEPIGDHVLGLVGTPLLQRLAHAHAQDDRAGRSVAPLVRRVGVAPDQSGRAALNEDIVLQQRVEWRQFRLPCEVPVWHPLAEGHRFVPIDEQSRGPPREGGVVVTYRLPHRGSCLFRTKNELFVCSKPTRSLHP